MANRWYNKFSLPDKDSFVTTEAARNINMIFRPKMTSKPIWKSKTFWFGLAVAALPLVEFISGQDIVLDSPAMAMILGGLIIALRSVTTQPTHLI